MWRRFGARRGKLISMEACLSSFVNCDGNLWRNSGTEKRPGEGKLYWDRQNTLLTSRFVICMGLRKLY